MKWILIESGETDMKIPKDPNVLIEQHSIFENDHSTGLIMTTPVKNLLFIRFPSPNSIKGYS